MGMNIRIRHVAAWIACFSILLAAVAPSVSRLLAAACEQDAFWPNVCSTTGPKLVSAAGHSAHHSSAPAKKDIHFEHCPFCLTHAGSFGLPPTTTFALPLTAETSVFPPLFYQSPRPLFVWVTPQTRAPPTLS